MVVACLDAVLPAPTRMASVERWMLLSASDSQQRHRAFGATEVALFDWVRQSRGFDLLLEFLGVDLHHHDYFTLRLLIDGPLTAAGVADHAGLDRSQGSRRVAHPGLRSRACPGDPTPGEAP